MVGDMTTIGPRRGAEPFGASTLLLGVAAGLVAMAFHPSGHDLVHAVDRTAAIRRDQAVHAVAIVGLLLQCVGMLALTRRLRQPRVGAAELAMVFWGAATFAGLIAAVASGFVAPGLLPAAGPPDAAWRWNHLQNQAFARVFVVASAVAIAAWSVAGWRAGLPRWQSRIGVIGPTLVAALVLVGHLRLDVHGFFVVVATSGLWTIGAAWVLLRPLD